MSAADPRPGVARGTPPHEAEPPLRVCVVAEFYPRAHDPVLGVWAHRQAIAARDAGAEVEILVLERPVPPRATRRRDLPGVLRTMLRQPRRAVIDGIPVTYVRFVSPPRGRSYGSWGRWAARPLRRALRRLHRRFPYDVVHAHNAVPAGDAVLRATRRGSRRTPLVVSVHGGDVFFTAPRYADGDVAVRSTFGAADLVLANSAGTADRCEALGATRTRVVRLGTDLPDAGEVHDWREARESRPPPSDAPRRLAGRWGSGPATALTTVEHPAPVVVTLGHLVSRKRHADVLRALWMLRDRHPGVRYRVVGDGPERPALEALAAEFGMADRIDLRGQLPHAEALAATRSADLFAMPSVDEAFGVAYVEAMAASMPAIASLGEPGPAEIAASGGGIVLVPPGDVAALAQALDALLADPARRRELGAAARRTVAERFTWERCGRQTVRAYRDVARGPAPGGG